MAYTTTNYKSKKALVEDFKAGKVIEVYQPGCFGPEVKDGRVSLEGPHYPEPHKWYVSCEVRCGVIVKINK
jgi:hypothetical protein